MKSKTKELLLLPGILVKGHRVASAPSDIYPYGTIERQKPYFKAGGLNLDGYFNGTLNISIAPAVFEMIKPAFVFRQVAWTDLHPPEDFSFSPCLVIYNALHYTGYIYYPHPETKKRHFQDASLVEVICDKIPDIDYWAHLEIGVDPDCIQVKT